MAHCERNVLFQRHQKVITLRMPSWASISSKPRLTSSSVSRCEMNGVDVDVAGEVALDELAAPGRGP